MNLFFSFWLTSLYSIGSACVHDKSLQSCLTLCDPMDCSPPGSSVHGIFPGKNTGEGCQTLIQGIFLTQGLNLCLLCLLHWQAGSLPLEPLGTPNLCGTRFPWPGACQAPLSMGIFQARILEWVAIFFSRGYSLPRDPTQVSCIAGRLFALWATRESLVALQIGSSCQYMISVFLTYFTLYYRL